MGGSLVEVGHYSRQSIRSNPDSLYVFGDNMAEMGLGGQAREARGEPNAVGIPTKWRPSTDPAAYFSDADFDAVRPRIQERFRLLADHIHSGGTVVWPRAGIGTGLSRLPESAPAIANYIDQCLAHLRTHHRKTPEPAA